MAVIQLFSGIHVDKWQTAVVAAVVLGVINLIIRPVIFLLMLPITMVTLGLFSFIINAELFYLVSVFVEGFVVDSFLWALIGSITFGVLNFVLNLIFVSKSTKTARVNFNFRGFKNEAPKKYGDVIDVELEPEKKKELKS